MGPVRFHCELEQLKQIRSGNARDLDKFADLLDIAIINLKEANQTQELGDGSLYAKLQRKLREVMLARYHWWIFENAKQESVRTLRTWVIQEADFHTIAAETVHGLSGNVVNETTAPTGSRNKYQHTFFGDTKGNRDVKELLCKVCGSSLGAWNCASFMHLSLPDRWDTAIDLKLCFCCLWDNHFGRSCSRSRHCGQNGCKELHNKLLHRSEYTKQIVRLQTKPWLNKLGTAGNANLSEQPVSSATEGKASSEEMTMTVPVKVKTGDRWMTVNALLDDASTKTYINADDAAELGLKGKTEQVTVNVLNGQVETFETRPVNFELESVNGNVKLKVSVFTANRVTGAMTVVDWYKYKKAMATPQIRRFSAMCF